MTKIAISYLLELVPAELQDWRNYVVPRHRLHLRPRGSIRIGLMVGWRVDRGCS